jgi:hypothetical protein
MLLVLGQLLKDAETVVLAWGADGISLINAEDIANTTLAASDAPWDVTRYTYLSSIRVTRFALSARTRQPLRSHNTRREQV